jgi:hypothetical protein
MKKYLVAAGAITAALAAPLARAASGLFIEPGVTYERGDGDLDFPAPFGGTSADVNGFGAMARLGFHISDAFFIAADGRYSRPTLENDDYDTEATAYNYGAVAGIQMPTLLGLRVWGSYIFGGELDPEKDDDLDVRFEDASGYRLGAGLRFGIVSVNLEYQQLEYDKAKLQSVGPFNPGETFDDVDAKNDSYILSVSFPISL